MSYLTFRKILIANIMRHLTNQNKFNKNFWTNSFCNDRLVENHFVINLLGKNEIEKKYHAERQQFVNDLLNIEYIANRQHNDRLVYVPASDDKNSQNFKNIEITYEFLTGKNQNKSGDWEICKEQIEEVKINETRLLIENGQNDQADIRPIVKMLALRAKPMFNPKWRINNKDRRSITSMAKNSSGITFTGMWPEETPTFNRNRSVIAELPENPIQPNYESSSEIDFSNFSKLETTENECSDNEDSEVNFSNMSIIEASEPEPSESDS